MSLKFTFILLNIVFTVKKKCYFPPEKQAPQNPQCVYLFYENQCHNISNSGARLSAMQERETTAVVFMNNSVKHLCVNHVLFEKKIRK